MYETALTIHSFVRWAVLLVGLWAFLRAFRGWMGRSARGSSDKFAAKLFTIFADVQLTLGLLLWFLWSPEVAQARKDFGAAMKDSSLRYWAVEHGMMMVIGIALVHVGKVAAGKAQSDVTAHRRAALFFGIALAILIAGTPWPFGAHVRPWLRLGG